jgi:hypothetical protein
MGIVLVMVMGLAAVANAGLNDNWAVYMKASDIHGTNFATMTNIYGTKTGSVDGLDGSDTAFSAPVSTSAILTSFDIGAGNASAGYLKDLRAPLTSALDQKIWNLRLYVNSSWTAGNVQLTGWNPSGTYALLGTVPSRVVLRIVNDPTGTYAAGSTIMSFDNTTHGTSANPTWTVTFTNSDAIKVGAGGGYVNMQLITPEPGSMVAMLSGLVGLIGFGIRRRK